jgi:hypothetical protein
MPSPQEIAAQLSKAQKSALVGEPYMRRPKMPPELGEWGGYAGCYFQPSELGAEVAKHCPPNRFIERGGGS